MAFGKKLMDLSLEEINSQLELIDQKQHKRIDYARNAARKAFIDGKLPYVGEGDFLDDATSAQVKADAEAAKAAEKAAKVAEKAAAKAAAKAKPSVSWSNSHSGIDTRCYTRHGVCTLIAVGIVEGKDEPSRAKVLDKNGKEHETSLASVRFHAVDTKYRHRYPVDKEKKTVSGKPSIGLDDDLTQALKGLGVDDLRRVASENSIEYKWGTRNPGMQRMCLGNVLRAMARKGGRVVVLGDVIVAGGMADEQQPQNDEAKEAA